MPQSTPRSTNPIDFQTLPQAVAVMSKSFPAGYRIPLHEHARDQLLYAVSGTMRVRTASHSWIVPPDRALYMPGGQVHGVAMHGPVEMRTLYIDRTGMGDLPAKPVAFRASPLLRALVLALLEEPVAYEAGSRAARISALILDEIARSSPLALSIPMPQDRRLLKLCEALIEAPDSSETLDEWAEAAGASRRTIARLFQAECGITFTSWRQLVRFHSAIDALGRGVPVAEVARSHGYRSASAFSAAFREVVGVTPRAIMDAGDQADGPISDR